MMDNLIDLESYRKDKGTLPFRNRLSEALDILENNLRDILKNVNQDNTKGE